MIVDRLRTPASIHREARLQTVIAMANPWGFVGGGPLPKMVE